MNQPESTSSHYSTSIAVLIVLVSVVGAIVAWRVAVALSDAGSADTRGLLAAVDKEDAATQGMITVLGHQTAYEAFVRNNSLYNAFYQLGSNYSAQASAFESAATRALDFLPRQYLDRDDKLDVQRDLGESIAEISLNKDVNSKPSFDSADRARQKAQWLLLVLTWLGGALLLLTLSDAILNPLRYLFLLGGLGSLMLGTAAVVLIEIVA